MPNATAPTSAPQRLPSPPMTTTTKRFDDDRGVEQVVDRAKGCDQRTGHRGEETAGREDTGEDMGLIDAKQADHAGVVGGGPQEDAGSREADHGEGEDADREPMVATVSG